MAQTLAGFLAALARHDGRVPLAELTARLKELDVAFDELRDYVRFDPDRYRRNLLHEGPAHQALVLCWRPGQRSPIHDHRGSSCGVRVIRGVSVETLFERRSGGHVYAVGSREHPPGTVIGSQDDEIHQISNLDEHEDLITLHVYTPPLLRMGVYSLTDPIRREWYDPVYGVALLEGAGI